MTTLPSVHLALPSYDRRAVDGLQVSVGAMQEISAMIAGMDYAERSGLPCIGAEVHLPFGGGKRADRRPALDEPLEPWDHRRNGRLLQHHFAQPYAVGIWRRAARFRPPRKAPEVIHILLHQAL